MDTMTYTVNDLMEMAAKVNGKARNRTIVQSEAEEILELVAEHANNADVHTIRVYSRDGFVANAYKYQAEIRYFEAYRTFETNEFTIRAGMTSAKRPHGSGSLTTINGRAA